MHWKKILIFKFDFCSWTMITNFPKILEIDLEWLFSILRRESKRFKLVLVFWFRFDIQLNYVWWYTHSFAVPIPRFFSNLKITVRESRMFDIRWIRMPSNISSILKIVLKMEMSNWLYCIDCSRMIYHPLLLPY